MNHHRATVQEKRDSSEDDEDDRPGHDTLRVRNCDLFRDGFQPSQIPRRSSFGSQGSLLSTVDPSPDLKGFLHGQLNCFTMENDKTLFLKVCQADGMVSCQILFFPHLLDFIRAVFSYLSPPLPSLPPPPPCHLRLLADPSRQSSSASCVADPIL